jgi:formamidopyrimidine-DNA glycosylase
MPELPEVETIARGLHQRVRGDVIQSVWIGSKPEPLKSGAAEITAALEGSTIARVERVGKHIVFELTRNRRSAPAQWIVHLGMTGSMLVAEPELAVEKHTHLIARLGSGRELRFVDPRRFGRLSVRAAQGPDERHGWATGVEPLEIGVEDFAELFRGRQTPIKSALLNQKLLRGVGNIYADEALFRAGVRPRRRAAKLTRDELHLLRKSLQKVLKAAIAGGGSSISDYVDAAGDQGFFQLRHRVYGREGLPCRVCKTPVKRVVIAGRSAHYCPHCQR